MDNVKHSFAEKIKQSSHFLTNSRLSNSTTTNEKGVTPTLMLLKKKSWAIPKRKKFPYLEKQKSILMKYLEEGEQTGFKRTPEQVISIRISSEKIKTKLI